MQVITPKTADEKSRPPVPNNDGQDQPPAKKEPPSENNPPVKTNTHREQPIEPVSTSGKTQGPHNPAFSKEDQEYFRTHLLSRKPIARFDSHGTVTHVLNEVDRYVPMIFGSEGEKALNTLHRLVRHYSVNEQWNYVVLSLTTGMARREVDALLSRKLGHEGPIIIDPDATTEEHQLFASETEARVQKERIIQANEASGKILLVLYAINNPDGNKDREVAMGHLQSISNTIGFMLEEDAKFRALFHIGPMENHVRRHLEMIGKMGTVDEHAGLYHDMHARLQEALGIRESGNLAMAMTIMRGGIIPARWADLGIIDSDAEFDRELARHAQAERAKHARGEKSPEHRLLEEAGEHEEDRQDIAADMREEELDKGRESAEHLREEVELDRRLEEREARHAAEDSEEFARDRAHMLNREAREDRLEDEHLARDKRLEMLEHGARSAGERAEYAHERAAEGAEFSAEASNEEALELRERRNTEAEAAARLNGDDIPAAEGTAEGRYSELDQRQRAEFALDERRENERAEINYDEDNRNIEEPVGAPHSQAEQATRDESEPPLEATGTQTPGARAEELQRTEPDESFNPQLTAENRAVEEGSRPARQGELDTPERAEQHEQQAADIREETQEQVAQQSAPPEPSIDDESLRAQRELNDRQQEDFKRNQEFAENLEQQESAQRKAGDDTKEHTEKSMEQANDVMEEQGDRLQEAIRPDENDADREQKRMVAEADAQREVEEQRTNREEREQKDLTAAQVAEINTEADQTFDAFNSIPEVMPDDAVVTKPEIVAERANKREAIQQQRLQRQNTAALAEEAGLTPPTKPTPS